jgi:hypothetical protein
LAAARDVIHAWRECRSQLGMNLNVMKCPNDECQNSKGAALRIQEQMRTDEKLRTPKNKKNWLSLLSLSFTVVHFLSLLFTFVTFIHFCSPGDTSFTSCCFVYVLWVPSGQTLV